MVELDVEFYRNNHYVFKIDVKTFEVHILLFDNFQIVHNVPDIFNQKQARHSIKFDSDIVGEAD
jgi:hypothetical protein